MIEKNNQQVFFELLKAGLWGGGNPQIRIDGTAGWQEVYRLAIEQSVLGLALAGLEQSDVKPPKELLLQWIGEVQIIEQRNKEMNAFVAELIEKLRKNDIYTLLVKGQGIAQCYEKPLWRCSGDVDLFLSYDNYQKAKTLLMPLASEVETENEEFKHLGMIINGWVVELHGHLYCGLSSRVDRELDEVLNETFYRGNVRSWNINGVQLFQLGIENDVFYTFTHILQHFYKEGVGIRQICDWCRLMWTYRDVVNVKKIESRIRKTGLVSEWKAFYNLASRYLGMPDLDSRFMFHDSRFDKKVEPIMDFILKSGNMGHNRDMSHFSKYPYLVRKCVSMGRRIGDLINHARIFPVNSLRFFPRIMWNGVRSAMRGE